MQNRMVRTVPNIYKSGNKIYKVSNKIRNKRADIFNYLLRNSVLEGSNLKWYSGLVRDSQQITNYREVN